MASSHQTLRRARQMRQEPTRAEQILWNKLRNRTLNGFKFSRQVPVGSYILDFVCRDRKLVVEVDGVTHGDNKEILHDERRTRWLEDNGYRVHRVWNQDIYESLNGVLDSLLLILSAAPHPALRATFSPEGRRAK